MRAAVLGSPISHSKSPALHLAAYRAAGLDWTYEAIEVTPRQLPAFLTSLGADWAGLSLTMPLKETVLDLVDSVSVTARTTRSANTVVFPGAPGRPRYVGTANPDLGSAAVAHNTDVDGMIAAVREQAGERFRPRHGAVLGAGATARSAILAIARLGADHVTVFARRPEAAMAAVAPVAANSAISLEVRPWTEAPTSTAADLVMSTVPAGGADALAEILAAAAVIPSGALLDVVYDPWPTPLARAWNRSEFAPIPGLLMLLHQAVEQVRLMTGQDPDVAAMREAVGL